MANKMANRMPDLYDKSDSSNLNKLFRLLSGEIDNINNTVQKVKDWRDIDQMKGKALDRLGEMLGVEREDRDDLKYRRIIKLQIVINQSSGNIETINEVSEVLLGENYLELKEDWHFEPAAISIVLDYNSLFEEISEEYEDLDNDPWYLNGNYNLDGERMLDGGYQFDLDERLDDIFNLIDNTKFLIERVAAGGVKVYVELPDNISIDYPINYQSYIELNNETNLSVDINYTSQQIINNQTNLSPVNVLDSSMLLDGSYNLDAERDSIILNYDIQEVSA